MIHWAWLIPTFIIGAAVGGAWAVVVFTRLAVRKR
jgi:hypothetical protein